jgi:fatty acid-binding protein DegV
LIRRRLRPDRSYRVSVGHANAEAQGSELLAAILDGLVNIHSSFLTTTGTALGVHGGPGMLVCAIQEYAPPSPRGSKET